MAVALLKEFLPTHEIKLADDEEEELIGDETDVLRFTQILDDGGNRVLLSLFSLASFTDTVSRSTSSNSKARWSFRCSWV
jgi:hypothetical protein